MNWKFAPERAPSSGVRLLKTVPAVYGMAGRPDRLDGAVDPPELKPRISALSVVLPPTPRVVESGICRS